MSIAHNYTRTRCRTPRHALCVLSMRCGTLDVREIWEFEASFRDIYRDTTLFSGIIPEIPRWLPSMESQTRRARYVNCARTRAILQSHPMSMRIYTKVKVQWRLLILGRLYISLMTTYTICSACQEFRGQPSRPLYTSVPIPRVGATAAQSAAAFKMFIDNVGLVVGMKNGNLVVDARGQRLYGLFDGLLAHVADRLEAEFGK